MFVSHPICYACPTSSVPSLSRLRSTVVSHSGHCSPSATVRAFTFISRVGVQHCFPSVDSRRFVRHSKLRTWALSASQCFAQGKDHSRTRAIENSGPLFVARLNHYLVLEGGIQYTSMFLNIMTVLIQYYCTNAPYI